MLLHEQHSTNVITISKYHQSLRCTFILWLFFYDDFFLNTDWTTCTKTTA